MSKNKLIRVDEGLIDVFGRIGKEFAEKIKKEYNLNQLFVPYTLSSKILAGKYNGKKSFLFKIKRTGKDNGVLEFVE